MEDLMRTAGRTSKAEAGGRAQGRDACQQTSTKTARSEQEPSFKTR